MSVRKSRENYRQIYGKSKASLWRNLSTGTSPNFFRTILCFVALVYNWYFFRTAVLRKLFDIRFSYKHCNCSHVCLLVKMASKTVTRSKLPQESLLSLPFCAAARVPRRASELAKTILKTFFFLVFRFAWLRTLELTRHVRPFCLRSSHKVGSALGL